MSLATVPTTVHAQSGNCFDFQMLTKKSLHLNHAITTSSELVVDFYVVLRKIIAVMKCHELNQTTVMSDEEVKIMCVGRIRMTGGVWGSELNHHITWSGERCDW